MMQHTGDAVLWQVDGEIITKETAIGGVLNAANELESMQLCPDLNRIGCEHYLNILLKLGVIRFTVSRNLNCNCYNIHINYKFIN